MPKLHVVCLALLFALALASGCGSNKEAMAKGETSLQDRYSSLSQVVRNLPNVQVTGETVVYRGASSLNSASAEMQFLVDDVLIPSMSQAEALFPLNSIRAVRVLQPVDAIARYGPRGAAGLIELILVK